MEIPGAREGTTYPGSRPRGGGSLRPASNPLYEYVQGATIGGVVSSLVLICGLRCLGVLCVCFFVSEYDLRGAPAWLYICN